MTRRRRNLTALTIGPVVGAWIAALILAVPA